MSDNQARPVKTTLTSLRIVSEIKRRDGATLAELADTLDSAKSTIHNHLATLVDEGLLVREDGEYDVGLRFLEFGEYARNRRPFYAVGEREAYRLAEATNEEANFSVVENGYMYPLEYVMGNSDPTDPTVGSKFLKVGSKFHMHNSASGKAVLAEYSDERVERIVASRGLPATTENTITTLDELLDELDGVRERGYSTNGEELQTGFRSIASSVTRPDGTVIGGLAIGGPSYRFDLETPSLSSYVDVLRESVETVEREIAELDDGR
jgi:DNA-binding IclR family transcriptional regulator